jgi:lysophospholipase L1-like esterase
MIENNFKSMVEICRANDIRPVLASILPSSDYPWKRNLDPGPKIVALNVWLKDYARKNSLIYLDYYSAMNDGKLGLSASLSDDGVHPNRNGYAVMGPLAEKAIASALAANHAAN